MNKLEILELAVVGYKRLALKDDKSFTITPGNIHLVLGTNGSGKSSLMELLTPLPPQTKDFTEDGYKKITFRYDTSIYEIYSSANKHTMIKDGVSIIENAGINKMIELCYEYFKITPSIHRFMLGKVKMTSMSLQHRKDFITAISNIDFDYIINLYNATKKRVRDNSAIIKHLANKVLSMKEYILVDNEVESLMKDKDDIKYLLTKLHEAKQAVRDNVPVIDIHSVLSTNINKIVGNLVDTKRLIDIHNVDKSSLSYIISSTSKELSEMNSSLIGTSNRLLELSNKLDVSTADSILLELNNEIGKITNGRLLGDVILDKSLIDRLSSDLYTIRNEDIKLIRDKLLSIRKSLESTTETYNNLLFTNTALVSKIDTYKSTVGKLNCPDCGFHFHNDAVDKLIEDISKEIEVNESKLLVLKSSIDKDKDTTNNYNSIIQTHSDVLELLQALNITKLSSYIPEYEYDLVALYRYIQVLVRDSSNTIRLRELTTKRETVLMNIDSTSGDEIVRLNKEYDKLKSDISLVEEKLNTMNKITNLISTTNKDIEYIRLYLNGKHSARSNDITKTKNKYINEIILDLNSKLTTIEATLDKFNYMSKNTKSHLEEIDRVKEETELLDLLIKELSPSNGLIAESIKSFLGEYIDEVNAIISKVWSYDLEVLPFDIKDIDKGVTYRFPVKTKGEDNATDIADTSESMSEIINIAFRIVSLKYMGLNNFPLMIDEFGRSMDEIHLIKSYDLLENICDTNDMQMFIIAHIKACYNRFKNAGISIVSNLNLETLE